MKLNIKRTMWIGIAFFGILLVWQLYGTYCTPMLTFLFAKQQFPEIVDEFVNDFGDSISPTITNLLTHINPDTGTSYITQAQFLEVQWLVGVIMALDNIAALFIMPIFGNLSDKTHSKLGKRTPYILVGSIVTAIALPFVPLFFNKGMAGTSQGAITAAVVGMICTMIVIIVFMMSYRSPAVALMPDLTPKPLRSKANGIINIVGAIGGAIGSVMGIVIPVTKYIDGSNTSIVMLEIPFIICSVVLLGSLVLLLIKVKENKLHAELDEEIKKADSLGESAEQVTENNKSGKLSKTNMKNLALILIAEVLWFMSLNAVETFQTNFVMFRFNTSSSGGAAMTIISGAASLIGYLTGGKIADKIGRKWTIFTGICGVTIIFLCLALVKGSSATTLTFDEKFPWIFFILLPLLGYSQSLIHICSFPLVTDYCTSDKLGKFTSLYYTASMLAQSVTPILLGLVLNKTQAWNAIPVYSSILMACAGIVFFFVKAPHNKDKVKNAKGLEALGSDD